MSQAIIAFVLLLVSLPLFAACDPSIDLIVNRPYACCARYTRAAVLHRTSPVRVPC